MHIDMQNTATYPRVSASYAATHQGVRDNQEDVGAAREYVANGRHVFLAAVFDGMGGHDAGEVAAATGMEALDRLFRAGYLARDLQAAVGVANTVVRDAAKRRRSNMGTTVAALAVEAGRAHVVHCGDSRCYLLRDGTLSPLTVDHAPTETEIREAIDALAQHLAGYDPAMREDALRRREAQLRSMIHRCLGTHRGETGDARELAVRTGDVFLLCSDGLEHLAPELIRDVLKTAADPARVLVDEVISMGVPGQDNATAVVVRIG